MTKTSEIWTHLHEEGMRTAAEVAQSLKIDVDSARAALKAMALFGEVERIEKTAGDPTSRLSYAVTGDCVTPYGVKLKDILPS